MSPDSNMSTNNTSTSLTSYTISKFDGTNYHLWKFKIQMVLEEKDLWDALVEDRPTTIEEALVWDRKDRKAKAVICLALSDAQLMNVRSATSAVEVWTKLEALYEGKGLANRLFLRRRFFTISMAGGEAVLEYVNRVKELAGQLEAINAGLEEEDVVMTLLCGLPESYNSLITSLESRNEDELSLEFVTARLLHEETKRKEGVVGDAGIGEKALFGGKRGPKGRFGGSQDGGKQSGTCFNCGKRGHYARDCRSKRKDTKQPHQQQQQANKAENNSNNSNNNQFLLVAALASSTKSDAWYIDSGASQHYAHSNSAMTNYTTIPPVKIYLGNDSTLEAVGKGDLEMDVWNGKGWHTAQLQDVLHVPRMAKNLLSVSIATSRGYTFEFGTGEARLKSGGSTLAVGLPEGNLYRLVGKVKQHSAAPATTANSELALWHARMGHLNMQSLKLLVERDMAAGVDLGSVGAVGDSFCEACVLGKQHRAPFASSGGGRATQPLELVHSDVCGPMSTPTFGGARYFVTFIDDYTHRTTTYLLKEKSQVFPHFKLFKSAAENELGHKIKCLRTDNGGEYVNKTFSNFLQEHGIKHQTSASYTAQQNGWLNE